MNVPLAEYVVNLVIQVMHMAGYPGIFFLMLLEGMLLPVPSEVVMAFGGFLAFSDGLPPVLGIPAYIIVLIAGSLGNLVGAYIAYMIGDYGGIPLIKKYGKYVLLKEDTVDTVQKWFEKYGPMSVFLTRLVPVFRTFISIPAGIARMNRKLFLAYTFIGAVIWDSFLVYLGWKFGQNWQVIVASFTKYTDVALAALGLLFIYWIYRALSRRKAIKEKKNSQAEK
ncbi:hypothetical protein IX51_11480 [uncultured archaeon]|nr:hypothetical protein IX51_11480 [uncultured archaeon]